MPIARPFAYNPSQTVISGATQSGDLAIATQTLDWNSTGLSWWMGPDEENAYIVAAPYPAGDFPTPIGNVGTVSFWSSAKTDSGFIALAIQLIGGSYATAALASDALFAAGYWTSYVSAGIITDNLFVELDASNYTSGAWVDASGNENDATINGATWLSDDGGIFDLDGSSNNISIIFSKTICVAEARCGRSCYDILYNIGIVKDVF